MAKFSVLCFWEWVLLMIFLALFVTINIVFLNTNKVSLHTYSWPSLKGTLFISYEAHWNHSTTPYYFRVLKTTLGIYTNFFSLNLAASRVLPRKWSTVIGIATFLFCLFSMLVLRTQKFCINLYGISSKFLNKLREFSITW